MFLKAHLSARLTSPGFVRTKTVTSLVFRKFAAVSAGERLKTSDKIGGKGNERRTKVERKRKNNFSVKKITLISGVFGKLMK